MAGDRSLDDVNYGRLGGASEPPPATTERGGLKGKLIAGAGIAAFMLVVAGGAFWLGWERHAGTPTGLEAPPLIKAEDKPIKISPEEPGGLDVPNRDKLVYKRLQGSGEKVGMERLMPDAEKPLAPPTPADAPPPHVAMTPELPAAAAPAPTPPVVAPGAPSPLPPGVKANGAAPAPAVKATPSPVTPPPSSSATAGKPPAAAKAEKATEKPADKPKEKSADKLADAGTAKLAAQPPKGVYHIQLLAARSPEEAQAAWTKIKATNGDVLKGVSAGVARADLGDRGTFYRLRAGPFDSEGRARAACAAMASRGASCVVIRTGGN